MSRWVEGERLDDAEDLFHSDSWDCPGGKPRVSGEQLSHLLTVLMPWFREEFAPKRKPPSPKVKVSPRVKDDADRGSQSQGRTLVAARSGGLCVIDARGPRAGRGLRRTGLHGCHACHMWTHAHPSKSRVNGWACKSYDPIDTGVLRRGRWVVLDEDGGFETCPRKVA